MLELEMAKFCYEESYDHALTSKFDELGNEGLRNSRYNIYGNIVYRFRDIFILA